MAGLIPENNRNPLADFTNFLGQDIDNTILSLGLRATNRHLVSHLQRDTLIGPITLRAKENYHSGSAVFNLQLEIGAIRTALQRKDLTRYRRYRIDIISRFKIQSRGVVLLASPPEGLGGTREGYEKDQQKKEGL